MIWIFLVALIAQVVLGRDGHGHGGDNFLCELDVLLHGTKIICGSDFELYLSTCSFKKAQSENHHLREIPCPSLTTRPPHATHNQHTTKPTQDTTTQPIKVTTPTTTVVTTPTTTDVTAPTTNEVTAPSTTTKVTSASTTIEVTEVTKSPVTEPQFVSGEEILDFFCLQLSHEECPDEYDLACGSDGFMYKNLCEFEKAKCMHRSLVKMETHLCVL